MGLSNNTTKTTQTNNSTSSGTTTPILPSYVAAPMENYYGQVGGLISQNWSNPNFLATPTNSLLQTAAGNASALPTGTAGLDQSNAFAAQAGNAPVTGYTAPIVAPTANVTAASLLDGGLDRYFNPYLTNVIDTTLADMDIASDKQRGDYLAAGARNKALSGSRFAIGETALEGELSRARASTDAGLRSSGFDRATTLAGQDADRRQQAAIANAAAANARAAQQAGFDAQGGMFNADLGQQQLDRMLQAGSLLTQNASTGSSIANNNVATQADLGQSLWDIDQYNNAAGVAGLGAIQGLLSGYEPLVGQSVYGTENGTSTGTQKSSGGLFQQLLGIGGQLGSAAILASDRRLKTSVERVGQLEDGLGVYEYDYVWGGPRQRGVMADEVAKLRPWALGPEIAGYATVNYGAL